MFQVQSAVSLQVLHVVMGPYLNFLGMNSDNSSYRARYTNGTASQCKVFQSEITGALETFNNTLSNVVSEFDVLTVDPSCIAVGHVLFYMDGNQRVLAKVPLLPINSRNVFVPFAPQSLRDANYYTAYQNQEA